MIVTATDQDAPSQQGFRSMLRCTWAPDEERGGLRARWEETLELVPVGPHGNRLTQALVSPVPELPPVSSTS